MERDKRPSRGRIRIAAVSAALLLGIVLVMNGGCVILTPLRVFRLNLRRAKAGLYESWYEQNRDAYESFRELARENGWKMYVACGCRSGVFDYGIGVLDCGVSNYTAMYRVPPGRLIEAVTPFREGRAAFVEYTLKEPWWRETVEQSDFELGVITEDGTVNKVPFGATDLALYTPVALGPRHVFFAAQYRKAWLYDLKEKTLHTVFQKPPAESLIEKVEILGDRYLLALTHGYGRPLLVFDAREPYREISRIEGVDDVAVVGPNIVVVKRGVCFLYDPESGTTERLTAGRFPTAVRNDEFLFLVPRGNRWAPHRYDIPTRRAEPSWEPPPGDTGFRLRRGHQKAYDHTGAIFSPRGPFLLVPWHIPAWTKAEFFLRDVLEYEVYDLTSGQKRGAFLNVYKGQFIFKFLGWHRAD